MKSYHSYKRGNYSSHFLVQEHLLCMSPIQEMFASASVLSLDLASSYVVGNFLHVFLVWTIFMYWGEGLHGGQR